MDKCIRRKTDHGQRQTDGQTEANFSKLFLLLHSNSELYFKFLSRFCFKVSKMFSTSGKDKFKNDAHNCLDFHLDVMIQPKRTAHPHE